MVGYPHGVGVAAVFILCNSIPGLFGNLAIVKSLPSDLPIYAVAVLAGADIGTTFELISASMILIALGAVLTIAGCKLIGVYSGTEMRPRKNSNTTPKVRSGSMTELGAPNREVRFTIPEIA